MLYAPRSWLLSLATALPALAQVADPGLPPPQAAPGDLLPLGRVQATVTGLREDDPVEDVLMIQVPGQRPLPVEGGLRRLLREHARNRTLQVVASLRGGAGRPAAVLVEAMQGVATQDLPIYAPGDDVGHDAPLGTLPRGQAALVYGGAVYGLVRAEGLPEGAVQLGRLSFGEPMVRTDDDQALSGVVTADREDDPVESAPVFHQDQRRLEVSGPLSALLRRHARYRTVEVQGAVSGQGIRVRAVRAAAGEKLPIFAMGDDVARDQPRGWLAPGEEVWVTGGGVYVEVLRADGSRGKVQAGRLSFGERLAPGVIEALRPRD